MSVIDEAVAREPGSAIRELQSQMPEIEYPLKASYMRPAVIRKTMSMVVTGTRPLAVVGDDRLSYEWLKINREHLKKIGAVLYIVSAVSAESVQQIKAMSGITDILILPHDKDFAENLGVRYYPIMLDSTAGVIRQ